MKTVFRLRVLWSLVLALYSVPLRAEVKSQEEEVVTRRVEGVLPGVEELKQTSYFRDGKAIAAVLTTTKDFDDPLLNNSTTKQLVFFVGPGSEVVVGLPLKDIAVRSTVPIRVHMAGDVTIVCTPDGSYCEQILFTNGRDLIFLGEKGGDKPIPEVDTFKTKFQPPVRRE